MVVRWELVSEDNPPSHAHSAGSPSCILLVSRRGRMGGTARMLPVLINERRATLHG
jgi:hypothetical protein